MKLKFLLCFYLFLYLPLFADEVRIVTAEEPPTNYYLESGEFSGTTSEIVNEIKKYLQLDAKIEVLPWARAYAFSKDLPNIVIFTAGKTQERVDHGFHFVGPVMTRKHVLWGMKKKNLTVNSIQDIKDQNLELVGLRGDWRTDFFINQGFNVYVVNSHEYSLTILLKGRIDLWISSDIEGLQIMKSQGIESDQIEMVFIFREAPSYIMLSRDSSQENINRWNNAFSELKKTDFFQISSQRWSKTLNLNLGFSDDKGYYIK